MSRGQVQIGLSQNRLAQNVSEQQFIPPHKCNRENWEVFETTLLQLTALPGRQTGTLRIAQNVLLPMPVQALRECV